MQRLYEFLRQHPTGVDALWAVLFGTLSLVGLLAHGEARAHQNVPVGLPVAAALLLVLTLRRRAPERMLLLALAAGLVQLIFGVRPITADLALFAIIYTVDKEDMDDLWSERAWIKANPMWGISVSPEKVREDAGKALNNPSAKSEFLRTRLNVWSNAGERLVEPGSWEACYDPTLDIDDFRGRPAWIGVDLASRRDMAAVVAIIDTGVRPHPDLVANLLPGYDFISDPVSAGDGDGRDGNADDEGDWTREGECGEWTRSSYSSWHGTQVAGVAGSAACATAARLPA